MLEDFPLDKIQYKDVEAFFDLKKPEGQRVDYKRELYRLKTEDEKGELLADVCSFANTYGGHLLLGINAPKGIPSGLVGVECDNPDAEILRMTDLIRAWSEPRLDVHSFKIVAVQRQSDARYVFVVRIEASPNAPHSGYASKNGIREFFTRHSNGKSPMNTSELRDVFVASETAFQRMRAFRDFRVMKRIHTDEELPASIGNGPKLVLHLFPFASFRKLIAFSAKELLTHVNDFPTPLHSGGSGDLRPNLDGLASIYRLSRSPLCLAYVQVYRNGVIEAVNAGPHFFSSDRNDDTPTTLHPSICEEILIRALRKYIKGLKSLGVQPPAWGVVSMAVTKGLFIRGDHGSVNEIDRAFLLMPEFEIANFDDDPGPLLKNTCDAIWNAAGLYESGTFNHSLQNARV